MEVTVARSVSASIRVAQRQLARRAAHRAGPARLALVAVLLVLLGAVWLSAGDLTGGAVGGAALLAAVVVDTIRRRYTTQDTLAAPWTQVVLLRPVRELTVYLGVAAGGIAAGQSTAWMWAAAALGVYGLRESIRAARWGASLPAPSAGEETQRISPVILADPSRDPEEPGRSTPRPPRVLRRRPAVTCGAAVRRLRPERLPGGRWGRRWTQPVRFAVIAVAAPFAALLADGRLTLLVLVLGGVLAMLSDAVGAADQAEGR